MKPETIINHRLFSQNKTTPILGKFLSFFLVILSLILSTQCTMLGLSEEESNDDEALVLLGLVGGRCANVTSCFRRFARTTDEGASLLVVDKNNRTLYDLNQGNIANDKHQIIFSGSKWITAVIIQRAIQRTGGTACNQSRNAEGNSGTLSSPLNLNSTTGEVLGWTTRSNITMRQLLAFTSGLDDPRGGSGQDSCIASLPPNATATDKDNCIARIRDNTASNPPGRSFVYNSNHMAVAQRMTEVACNQTWNELYRDEVVTPLGFDGEKSFWTGNLISTSDPSSRGDGSLAGAYGLVTSPREYSRIMLALLREGNAFNGTADVTNYLSSSKVVEILSDQSEDSNIGFSQFAAFGYQWKYGLGNWRYCSNPSNPEACDRDLISHSVGANGFFPWLDRNRGYFGIISVNNLGRRGGVTNLPSTGNSLFFAETIRPMIHGELQ